MTFRDALKTVFEVLQGNHGAPVVKAAERRRGRNEKMDAFLGQVNGRPAFDMNNVEERTAAALTNHDKVS